MSGALSQRRNFDKNFLSFKNLIVKKKLSVVKNLKLNSKTPFFKMVFIFVITIISFHAQAQGDEVKAIPEFPVVKSNKNNQQAIPKKLVRKFRRDAARLALRMESKKEDLRYQNVVIPKDNIEGIYNILTNIYQNDETAKSIANCNVHTFSKSIHRSPRDDF